MRSRTHFSRLPGSRLWLLPVVLVLALAGALCPLGLDPLLAEGDTKLKASDGQPEDRFGWSVAGDGNTAVVGAPFDDDKGTDAGAVYVFVYDGTTWTQQAKLTAADGAHLDYFGFSVAVQGDTVLVGVPFDDDKGMNSGSVRVFTRSGTTWTQQTKLIAADGEAHENFGEFVSLDDNTALISAQRDDDKGTWSGSAYVFVRNDGGTTWTQQAKLIASDGAAENFFGASVSLSGDTALIGAPYHAHKGAVYAFVRDGTTWSEQQKLTAPDGTPLDFFGSSVTLYDGGDKVRVGAPYNDEKGTDAGAAYAFVSNDGDEDWTLLAKQTAADGRPRDLFGQCLFGWSLGDIGRIDVTGAPGDDDLGNESGAAYVRTEESPPPTTTRLNVPNVTTGIGQTAALRAKLTREDTGVSLTNANVIFKIDGEPVGTGTTNLKGIAKLLYIIPESMRLGDHSLTAKFEGDDTFAASSDTANLKVKKGKVRIRVTSVSGSAGSTVELKANLKNKSYKPLSGRELTFMLEIGNLDPVILGNATTDSNGDASLSGNIPPELKKGTYTIKVTFAGDSLYKPGKGKDKMTVN